MSAVSESHASRVAVARHYHWPLAGAIYLLVVTTAFVAFSGATTTLLRLWLDSSEFGHGLVVPFVIGYVLWLDRRQLLRTHPRPWAPGLAAVAASAALWLASHALGVLVGEQTALMLMLPSLALALFGPSATWRLGFVFAFPFVASPLWWLINPLLQDVTAYATAKLVRQLDVPIYREGNYLTIAYGRFLVAEFCSGLRYLLASVSLAALFAYLNIRSLGLGIVMVLAGVAVALFTNWLRVSSIVIIGHVSEMQHPMIEEHIFFGWVIFSLAMVPLALFGYRLARLADRRHGASAAKYGPRGRVPQPLRGRRIAALAGTAMMLIAIGPVLTRPVAPEHVESVVATMSAAVERLEIEGWSRERGETSGWKPLIRNADVERVLRYTRSGVPVEVYLAVFAEQRQGAEVINDENRPYDPLSFRAGPRHVEGAIRYPASGIAVRESLVVPAESAGAEREWLVWDTARVAGEFSLGDVATKLLQVKTLLGATRVASVVALATPIEASVDASAERLTQFLNTGRPDIERALQAAEQVAR